MTVHDYIGWPDWSDEVADWEGKFDHNDVVISEDRQERLGEDTIVVSRINLANDQEYVHQLGLFWRNRFAKQFAENFDKMTDKSREEIENMEPGPGGRP